jgi:hypothetical protein
MTGRIILRIAYGIDVKSTDDPFVLMAEDALEAISVASQFRGMLFDMVPIRAWPCSASLVAKLAKYLLLVQKLPIWLPGSGFKKSLLERSQISSDMLSKPWDETIATVASFSFSLQLLFIHKVTDRHSHLLRRVATIDTLLHRS